MNAVRDDDDDDDNIRRIKRIPEDKGTYLSRNETETRLQTEMKR